MMVVLASSSSVLISKQSSEEKMSPTARGQTKASSMVTIHSHITERVLGLYLLFWRFHKCAGLDNKFYCHSASGIQRSSVALLSGRQKEYTLISNTCEVHNTLGADWLWHLWKPSHLVENRPNLRSTSSNAKGFLHWPSLCVTSLYMELPSKTIWWWVRLGQESSRHGYRVQVCHSGWCDLAWTCWPLWPSDPSCSDLWHMTKSKKKK